MSINKIFKGYIREFSVSLLFYYQIVGFIIFNVSSVYGISESIAVIFSIIVLIIHILHQKEINKSILYYSKTLFIIIPVFLYLIISSDTSDSSTFLLRFIVSGLLPLFLLLFYISNSQFSFDRFARTNLFMGVVFACVIIFNVFLNSSEGRLSVYGHNAILTCRLLALSGISYFFIHKKNIFHHLSLVPIFIAILFTGSRGPFFSGIIAIFLVKFLCKDKVMTFKKKFVLMTKYSLFLIFVLIILIYSISFFSDYNKEAVDRFNLLYDEGISDKAFSGRFTIGRGFIDSIQDDEIVFGKGLFARESDHPAWQYPHNIFIELLYKFGLFGLIYFSLFIFLPLIKYFKNYKISSKQINFILCIYLYYLFNANLSGDLIGNLNVFVFGYLLTFMILKKRRGDKN